MLRPIGKKTFLKQLNNESTSKENQIDNSSHLMCSQIIKISQEELISSQKTQSSQNDSFKDCLHLAKWAIQDSQSNSTQSSEQNNSKPKETKKISSQEIFGEDYELLDKNSSQNSQINSQNSNLFISQNKHIPMLNSNTANDSDIKLTPISDVSIPNSQKTNYFEISDNSNKLKLPLTPEQSQDYDRELFPDEDDYDEDEQDNDDTIIDLNQKPNYSNDKNFNRQYDSNESKINQSQHPYVKNISCIRNQSVKQPNLSIGKSNSAIKTLKSISTIDKQFSSFDNDFNVNIGKSENNYDDNMQIDEEYENNYARENNKLSSFNQPLNLIGKGKYYSNDKYSNQMEYDQLTGINDYQGREQQLNNGKKNLYSNRSSTSEYYDSFSNLSRSSTPASCVTIEDVYNEESSNDSLIRKRRKTNELPNEIVSRSKSKITKTSIQSNDEMKSLSQQMEGSCSLDTPNKSVKKQLPLKRNSKNLTKIKALSSLDSNQTPSSSNQTNNNESQITDDSQFEYYDNLSRWFYSGKDSLKLQSNNSFNRITRSKEGTPKYLNISSKNLSNYEESIETPFKRKSQNSIGPIPKSSAKKTRSTKKSKQENSFIMNKTPIQRKLNISEISSNDTQSKSKLSNDIKSKSKLSNKFESVSQIKTTKQSRKKTESISSAKSFDSLVIDLNHKDYDDIIDKKERRKMKNKDAAKDYRQRQKEKEIQMDENLENLESKYDELRLKLKSVLVQKHTLINMIIDDGNKTLPDYIKKNDLLI